MTVTTSKEFRKAREMVERRLTTYAAKVELFDLGWNMRSVDLALVYMGRIRSGLAR